MKKDLFDRINHSICSNNTLPLHLHGPSFDQIDKDYLNSCIDSGFVSSVGAFVNEFEEKLQVLTGTTGGAVSCSNGTAALHLCLIAADVAAGDEVLIPSLTFIATANACSYQGATPHFIEANQDDLSVDPVKLKSYLESICKVKDKQTFNKNTGKKISALIVMHCFGHIGDMDALSDICDEFHISLIEDAAESLGSTYKGKPAGSLSKYAAISFNGNKIITTGGGGMFLTSCPETAKKIKHLSTTAKVPHKYKFIHDQIGYNYRMPNLNAALGMAQLTKLPKYIEQKRSLAKNYEEAFAQCEYAKFMTEPSNCKSNYWLNAIRLNQSENLDEVITYLHENKIFARPIWTPLHKLLPYKDCPRTDLSVTEDLENRILCLPSSPFLSEPL